MKKLIFLIILLFVLVLDVNIEPIKYLCVISEVILKHKVNQKNHMPSETQLLDTLKSKGFRDPVGVWRIAMWESGHMRSVICKTRNNLFGLRTRDYIYFNSWLDCIDYMKRMEDIRWAQYSVDNSGDYYDFIHWLGYKTGHSRSNEDLEYINKLKKLDPPQSL